MTLAVVEAPAAVSEALEAAAATRDGGGGVLAQIAAAGAALGLRSNSIPTAEQQAALVEVALSRFTAGGYFAKSCSESNVLDALRTEGLIEDELLTARPESVEARMAAGNVFEAAAWQAWEPQLRAHAISYVAIAARTDTNGELRAGATLAAMDRRVQIIWNARLPRNYTKHTSREPDFLVYLGERVEDGQSLPVYAPGDVKDHKPTTGEAKLSYPISTLGAPAFERAVEVTLVGNSVIEDDLQLAGYADDLQALGRGVVDGQPIWGAVIGRSPEGEPLRLVWRRLDIPLGRRKVSALEKYRTMFSRNLGIVGARLVRQVYAKAPLDECDRGPEFKPACAECIYFKKVCRPELVEADHITLLQGVTPDRAVAFYDRDVTRRAQLARLDYNTAVAVAAKVPVLELIAAARDLDTATAAATPLAAFIGERNAAQRTAVANLSELGLATALDLCLLDDVTAEYAEGLRTVNLPAAIDMARVACAGKVHRARGVEHLEGLARTAIELDFDVEDADGIVYMIGVLATGRRTRSGEMKQRAEMNTFVDWTHTAAGEAKVFAEAWEYLTFMQAKARMGKHSFSAYHFSLHERSTFRRLAVKHAGARGVPTLAQVEDFFASPAVVDMLDWISRGLIWPTENTTLKTVAGYCGFSWADESPSGGNSVAWYQQAIAGPTEAEREASRQRIIAYNGDDTAAQLAIRDWLTRLGEARKPGLALPSVAELDRVFRHRPRR